MIQGLLVQNMITLTRGTYLCEPVQVVGDISWNRFLVGTLPWKHGGRVLLGRDSFASLFIKSSYQVEDVWMLKVF